MRFRLWKQWEYIPVSPHAQKRRLEFFFRYLRYMTSTTSAERWANEAQEKYGQGAVAWLKRWIVNYSIPPCSERDDATVRTLEEAIRIVESRRPCAKN